MGYRINYDDEAIALTEAPEKLSAFLKQRFRWMFGVWQTTWKNKHLIFNIKQGSLGWVGLPNILIFQIISPLLSPAIDLLMLISFFTLLYSF